MSDRFIWDPAAACWVAGEEPQGGVALADSWLLDEGRTIRLDLHRERFLSGAAELAADRVQVRQAWDGLNAALPTSGRWFPRVDLLSGGELTLALPLMPIRALTVQGSYVGNVKELRELVALAQAGEVPALPVQTVPQRDANDALMRLRDGKVTGRLVLKSDVA